jgi:hypothetical protein
LVCSLLYLYLKLYFTLNILMDKKSKQEKTEVVEATSTVTHYNKAGRERQPAAGTPGQ